MLLDFKMTVTVIIPCYNSENYISDTLLSILNQTLLPEEILIIDDFSKDNTLEKVQSLSYHNNFNLIKVIKLNKNCGVSYARNLGILNSNTELIAFCDSDDIWHQDKLKCQINFMSLNNIEFSYTSYFRVRNNTVIGKVKAVNSVSYKKMLFHNYIACSTVIIRKELCVIGFPNFQIAQDYALWLIILKNYNIRAFGLDMYLCNYLVRSDSISSRKIYTTIKLYKMYQFLNLNVISSILFVFTHTFISIFNRLFKYKL